MSQKRYLAFNRTFNLFEILGVFIALMAYFMFCDNELSWGIGLSVLALLFIATPAVLEPFVYLFDSDGVSACYLFFPKERYLWKNIHEIWVSSDSSGRHSILDLFFSGVFEINGMVEGEERFYMKGRIRKSFRAKRLIKKYWDGEISGYLIDDIKAWWNKRKNKQRKIIKQHLTDEIVPMEREIRATVRNVLNPLCVRAEENGLEIRTEYLYVTNELDEFKSRPDEGYTYTLSIEISRPNEQDDEKIICNDFNLIFVRLGKKAYRGIINKKVIDEIQPSVSEVLEQIIQVGIENY